MDNLNNPNQFWKELRSCTCLVKKKTVNDSITKSDWHDHFMKVFNTNDTEQRVWGDQADEQSLTEVESLKN